MRVPPREARELTLWEYEALLVNHNKMRADGQDPEPASIDQVRETEQFFADHPELLN